MSFSPQKTLAIYRGSSTYGSRGFADTTVFPIYAGSKPVQYLNDSDIAVQLHSSADGTTQTLVLGSDYTISNKNVVLLGGSLLPDTVLGIFQDQPIMQPYYLTGAAE